MSDQFSDPMNTETVDLFHTPKSWDELHNWIGLHPEEDRPPLVVAAMMAWNLAHYNLAQRAQNEYLG